MGATHHNSPLKNPGANGLGFDGLSPILRFQQSCLAIIRHICTKIHQVSSVSMPQSFYLITLSAPTSAKPKPNSIIEFENTELIRSKTKEYSYENDNQINSITFTHGINHRL